MTSPFLNSQIGFLYQLAEIYLQAVFTLSKNIYREYFLNCLSENDQQFVLYNTIESQDFFLKFWSSFIFFQYFWQEVSDQIDINLSVFIYHLVPLVNRHGCFSTCIFFTQHFCNPIFDHESASSFNLCI